MWLLVLAGAKQSKNPEEHSPGAVQTGGLGDGPADISVDQVRGCGAAAFVQPQRTSSHHSCRSKHISATADCPNAAKRRAAGHGG